MTTVTIPRGGTENLPVLCGSERVGTLGRATGATKRRLPWVLSMDGIYWDGDGNPKKGSGFSVVHVATIAAAEQKAATALGVDVPVKEQQR